MSICVYMNVKIYYKHQSIKWHKHHSQLTLIIPSIKVHNQLIIVEHIRE